MASVKATVMALMEMGLHSRTDPQLFVETPAVA
jgi:hypothetical protein